MKKLLAKIFLAISGWNIYIDITQEVKRSVMIAAPHTSNWDFPFAIAAFWKMDLKVKYFIKDMYTKGPWAFFFKWTGAIGVDKKKAKNGLTEFAIELMNKEKDLIILVPAEGTRKRVEKWRTGFYRIAIETNVPISLAYLDYEKKEGGVLKTFKPSGIFEDDMETIQIAYKGIKAKFPEQFNSKIY